MTDTVAEGLAAEIEAGTYAPSLLDDCTADLPIDRNPHIVRFTQFILFTTPAIDVRSPQEPSYLILQQYDPSDSGRKNVIKTVIKPLAAAVPAGTTVPVRERSRASAAARARVPAGRSRTQLMALLEPLQQAGFTFTRALTANRADLPSVLEGILTHVLLPDPYQPFDNPHPHFALCATFEQVWEPRGYTRGELVSSISLAPGEQLSLDIHSWDKSTIKNEEDLATESEMRIAENITQRDVHTIVREMSSELGGNLTATGVTIPGVPAAFGGGVSGKVTQNTRNTTEKLRERTVQASNTLKSTRKLRVEISRETGREQRQTRTIANTNRCHTLNCNYFEVMANYVVSTRRVSLDPCLLVPSPTVEVTAPWVLCHEDVLRQALRDKVFLPGFDAARTLEANIEFENIVKEELSDLVEAYVQAILNAYDALLAAAEAVNTQSSSQLASAAAASSGGLGWATATALGVLKTQLHQVLYISMLATNRVAINALEKLKADRTAPAPRKAIDALRDFLAVIRPSDYRPNMNAALSTGLALLGLPAGLLNALLGWGFLFLTPDDSGLFNAVKAAARKVKAMDKSVQDQPDPMQQGVDTMELAKARVAFAQLKGHIEDNWLHYVHAMWLREDADQRFARLQGFGAVAAVLENDLLGFLGHKAAFPIADRLAVKSQVDFETIIGEVADFVTVPQLITVPTQGTLLEAIVGTCDGCEDFIQQSRVLDLRTQTASAQQQEAEARRRDLRLSATPPDLSAAGAIVGENVTVNVGRIEPS